MKYLLFILTLLTLVAVYVFGFEEKQTSPEMTLQEYLKCFETMDERCILDNYHGIESFYTGDSRKIDFEITRKVIFGPAEVESWNDEGIIPQAQEGDVFFDVLQTTNGRETMYNYNLRKYGDKWLIYSHAAAGMI